MHRNGIITNYLVKYRESKTATKGPGTWKNISILSLVANIADLEYYTLYDITVAGVNTAGIGNYSEIISVRTDADGKLVFLQLFEIDKLRNVGGLPYKAMVFARDAKNTTKF